MIIECGEKKAISPTENTSKQINGDKERPIVKRNMKKMNIMDDQLIDLIDLIQNYEKLTKKNLHGRTILVLEMIERVITFPPVEPVSKEELAMIDGFVQEIMEDLRKDKQYLFSVRIGKIWKNRKHICQLGENWHKVKKDYMDDIEYHEEIKWLRDERKRIANLL
jgi:hypothetical protein